MEVEQLMPLQYVLKATSQEAVKDMIEAVNNSKGQPGFPSSELVNATIEALRNVPNQQQATDLLNSLRAIIRMCNSNGWATPQEVSQVFPDGFHANLQKLLCNIIASLPVVAAAPVRLPPPPSEVPQQQAKPTQQAAAPSSPKPQPQQQSQPPKPTQQAAAPSPKSQPQQQQSQSSPKPAPKAKTVSNSNRPPVSLPRLEDVDWRIDVKSASEKGRMNVPTVLVQMTIQKNQTKVGEQAESEKVIFEVGRAELETMLEGLGRIRDQLNTVAGASSNK